MWGRREDGYTIFEFHSETVAAIEQCRVADKIEDLFDEIVGITNQPNAKPFVLEEKEKIPCVLDFFADNQTKLYGAIWTNAGLLYAGAYRNHQWVPMRRIDE